MTTEHYIGARGIIFNRSGMETPVTFSLYPDTADGFCRVSDGSNALSELYNSGNKVRLYGKNLDVTIVLTSDYTFRVTSPTVRN